MPKLILFIENTSALCKLNFHRWETSTVHSCTRHHYQPMGFTVPKLLAKKPKSANCPILLTNKTAQFTVLAYGGIITSTVK